jgi:hypothetical protein
MPHSPDSTQPANATRRFWAAASFGEQWRRYRERVPAFLPRLHPPSTATP